MFWFRLGREDRMVPTGVETEDDFGTWRVLEADMFGADGHTAIRAEFEGGPLAPNIRPAGAARRWADDGALLVFG